MSERPATGVEIRGGPPPGASQSIMDALIALCPLLGIRSDAVVERPTGQIWLSGTGVMLVWRGTAWELRESYQVADGDTNWRSVSRAVVVVPVDQPVRAAKAMAMLHLERRIDGMLSGGTRAPEPR